VRFAHIAAAESYEGQRPSSRPCGKRRRRFSFSTRRRAGLLPGNANG